MRQIKQNRSIKENGLACFNAMEATMSEDMIQIEATYSLEDIENFQKYHMLQRTTPIKLALVGIIIAGCFIMSAVSQGGGIMVFNAVIYAVLLAFIVIYLIRFAPKRAAKKLYETNQLIRDTQFFKIDRDFIRISSANGEARIGWNKLYKAVETKDNFVFYTSKMQAYIVPKRYLNEAEGQTALLRELLKIAPTPKKEKAGKSLLLKILAYGILFLIVMAFAYFYNQ